MSYAPSQRAQTLPRSGIRRVLDAASADTINLAIGDPDLDTPAHIVQAANSALQQGATHYTHGRGLLPLREAIAQKLTRENHLPELNPAEQIVVTSGALNALAAVCLAVVNPGDLVLVPDPGFANYVAQIQLAGGVAVPYACDATTNFQPDFAQLAELAPGARMLVINTPSNPTGAVLTAETLTRMTQLAQEHGVLVLSDEAYEHLIFDGHTHVSTASVPEAAEHTLTIQSFSKSWAMTGWRIGYVVGPASILDAVANVQEHLIGCPPEMNQRAALAALTGPTTARDAMVAEYAARRALVNSYLSDLPGVDYLPPAGSFYAFPRINHPAIGEELAATIAREAGVLTVPGNAFGQRGAQHVRISFATGQPTLEAGLERFRRWALSTLA